MNFLIAIIHGDDVYLAAPKNRAGYTHILKEKKFLLGCINDNKTLLHYHCYTPILTEPNSLKAIKEFHLSIPEGTYDIVICNNENIYHLNHQKEITVSQDFLVIGDFSERMYGAVYASRILEPEDRIKIACESAGVTEYVVERF